MTFQYQNIYEQLLGSAPLFTQEEQMKYKPEKKEDDEIEYWGEVFIND